VSVTKVALPIERALHVADQTGRHGGTAHVDRSPVAQTLYEGDELVEVSLESCAPRSCSDCQELASTAANQRVNERVGEPSPHGFGVKLRRAHAELGAGAWVGAG
jgi:hypothetical protein